MLPILKDVTEEPAEEGLRETEIVDEINRILNATSFRCAVYFSRAVSSSVKYDNDYKFELRRWPVSPPEEVRDKLEDEHSLSRPHPILTY